MSDPRLTGTPCDSREKLLEIGENPTVLGSCSAPGPGNKGCTYHRICRFTAYKERGYPGTVGVAIINGSSGGADGRQMPCFDYYRTGLHARRMNHETTKDQIEVVGYEGDKILSKGSRAAHLPPDKHCEACKAGKCNIRRPYEEEQEIEPFVRLSEATGSSMAEKLRSKMRRDPERDLTEDMLRGNPRP